MVNRLILKRDLTKMPQINIEQIKSFLDVERISIAQKTTAYCFLKDPKQIEDKDFIEKLDQVKKLFSDNKIEFKLVDEAEKWIDLIEENT